MKSTLLLVWYFFLSDQRMGYKWSAHHSLYPKPAVILTMLGIASMGVVLILLTAVAGAEKSLFYDALLVSVLNTLILLFPGGLIMPGERMFLWALPASRQQLRRFEFCHTLATVLYVGLVLVLPATLFTCTTSDFRNSAALLLTGLVGYCSLVFLYSLLFQLRRVERGEIPTALVALLIAGSTIWLYSMVNLGIQGRLRGVELSYYDTPGTALASLESFLSGQGEGSVQTFGILSLMLLSAVIHWRLSGRAPEPHRNRLKSSPSIVSITACSISAYTLRYRTWALTASMLLLTAWRVPRFTFFLICDVAFVWVYVRVNSSPQDIVTTIVFFTLPASLALAGIYALCTTNYDPARLPFINLFGASPLSCSRSCLRLSCMAVFFLTAPALLFFLYRASLYHEIPASLLWLALYIYAAHLLMQLVRPGAPLSFPAVRTGSAGQIISNLLITCLLGAGLLLVLAGPLPLPKSLWVANVTLALLIAVLQPVVRRVEAIKLRYLDCF
ncbi:MAG: hypothetical protein ACRD1R_20610 [Acidobacteriota bacterium]